MSALGDRGKCQVMPPARPRETRGVHLVRLDGWRSAGRHYAERKAACLATFYFPSSIRAWMREIAHEACSAISGSGPDAARCRAGSAAGAAHIPQGHADIAQKSAPLGPQHRRPGKPRLEARLVQRQQFHQIRRFQSGAAMLRHHRTRPRKTVPRTDRQAIVASENPVAHGRAQFHRDRAFQLDGQIGNAAARVQLERAR